MIGTTWLLKRYHGEIQTYTIRARDAKLNLYSSEYFSVAGRSVRTGLVGEEPRITNTDDQQLLWYRHGRGQQHCYNHRGSHTDMVLVGHFVRCQTRSFR